MGRIVEMSRGGRDTSFAFVGRRVLISPFAALVEIRRTLTWDFAAANRVDGGVDISGLRDPAMRAIAASLRVPVVIMHMPGDDPTTMQQHAHYVDIVAEVVGFLRQQVDAARSAGVEQIILDPGIGFGKTAEHNRRRMMFGARVREWIPLRR